MACHWKASKSVGFVGPHAGMRPESCSSTNEPLVHLEVASAEPNHFPIAQCIPLSAKVLPNVFDAIDPIPLRVYFGQRAVNPSVGCGFEKGRKGN